MQVDGRHHPDRGRHGEREPHQVEGPDERRPDSSLAHPSSRHVDQELPGQGRRGAVEEVADDGEQGQDHRDRHGEEPPLRQRLAALLAGHLRRASEARARRDAHFATSGARRESPDPRPGSPRR